MSTFGLFYHGHSSNMVMSHESGCKFRKHLTLTEFCIKFQEKLQNFWCKSLLLQKLSATTSREVRNTPVLSGLNSVIHYFQFVNITHLFQPSYSPSVDPENWSIQYQPVDLPTKCSIKHLVIHCFGYIRHYAPRTLLLRCDDIRSPYIMVP